MASFSRSDCYEPDPVRRAAETNRPPACGHEPEALADFSVESSSASGSAGTAPAAARGSVQFVVFFMGQGLESFAF